MWTGRPWKAVLLLAAGAAGGGAAYAVASVPDGNGVIHGCVQLAGAAAVPATAAGNLRIIDPAKNRADVQHRPSRGRPQSEAALNWNTAGPQGVPGTPGTPGPPGTPGQSVTIAGGNTLTISGGQVITVGGGAGLTIQSPRVSERGPAVAHVSITGDGASFDFDARAVTLATTQGGTHATGGGGGAGKVGVHDLSITKKVDKASPKLSLACAAGTHFKKVTITLRRAGKIYLTYNLTDVLISSVQVSGSGAGQDVPLESISLNFAKIAFQYTK